MAIGGGVAHCGLGSGGPAADDTAGAIPAGSFRRNGSCAVVRPGALDRALRKHGRARAFAGDRVNVRGLCDGAAVRAGPERGSARPGTTGIAELHRLAGKPGVAALTAGGGASPSTAGAMP